MIFVRLTSPLLEVFRVESKAAGPSNQAAASQAGKKEGDMPLRSKNAILPESTPLCGGTSFCSCQSIYAFSMLKYDVGLRSVQWQTANEKHGEGGQHEKGNTEGSGSLRKH